MARSTRRQPTKFETFSINSLDAYVKTILDIWKAWNKDQSEIMHPWYRGVSDASFALLPTLYRDGCNPNVENDLRLDFQLKAPSFLSPSLPENIWKQYFMMRHHGLPTRLLDWSESALVSLHFALRENQGSTDAAVWVFDPWALSKASLNSDELVDINDECCQRYLSTPFDKSFRMAKLPAPILGVYVAPRIAAQRGVFTVHGHDTRSLDAVMLEHSPSSLVKIVIRKASVRKVFRELYVAGVTDVLVFPDLDALCRDIRREWIDEYVDGSEKVKP
jgi:hypothetical protein